MNALASVVAEVWTDDHCRRHHGVVVRLSNDLRGPCLTVADKAHTTHRPLTFPRGSAHTVADSVNQQILAAIREHKQPYGRYPATAAADELAYLAG